MNGFSAEEMHSFQKYLRYNLFQVRRQNETGVNGMN